MRLEVDISPSIIPASGTNLFEANSNSDASKEALNMGIRSAQSGDRVNARIALLRATELDDRNENAWLWLASISEYPEELVAFLENVLAINPANDRAIQWMAATRTLLAKTFLQRGTDAAEADQPMYAEDCFRKALEYDPKNTAAWLSLAELSQNKEDRIANFERVLAIEPENKEATNALSSIRAEEESSEFAEIKKAAFDGDAFGALALLENFSERFPSNLDAWMLRSHLVTRPADKLAALKLVLKIDPTHNAAKLSFDSLNAMFADAEAATTSQEKLSEAGSAMVSTVAQSTDDKVEVEFPSDEPEFSQPIAEPNEELIFEEIVEEDVTPTFVVASAESKDFDVPEWNNCYEAHEDWNRETEAFSTEAFAEQENVSEITAVGAIPMPFELPSELTELSPERTGFETTVEKRSVDSVRDQTPCPFCSFNNDLTTLKCSSCLAVLSLSDIDELLANSHADKYVIRKAVERMETEKSSRAFDESELTTLGIGHLNLKNLQYGFNYLHEAADLYPENEILNGQVDALEHRLDEIRRKDEAHAALVKGKTILVVDDSATVRKLIAGKLEKSGYEVFCSTGGAEALERIKDLTPDLVLLDIVMPEMDGYQVCRQIRGWVATSNTPVVMISGKDGSFDRSRADAAGSNGFITKPFGPETLMKAVEFYLAGGNDADVAETPFETNSAN
ncbi:MAG: response regulator [Pyrinomonadaceae bacterium]